MIKLPVTVIHVLGMKNTGWLQKDVLPKIVRALESAKITIFIEVCYGGGGLQPTRLLAHPELVTYIINDTDIAKINLYTTINTNRFNLEDICECVNTDIYSVILNTWISKDTRYLKAERKILNAIMEKLCLKKYDPTHIRSAITMFKKCCSSRRTQRTVEEHFRFFSKKCDNIHIIAQIFENCKKVKITCYDLIEVIDLYKGNPNAVIWVDPPYYLSNGEYPENQPEHESHVKIAEHLSKVKCKFVLFLRIKASRASGNDIGNEAIDDALISFYDNHYAGKGFYYKDMPVNQKGKFTMERVITNFSFETAIEYK